ncbi:hypothetical protein O181_038037 [Austropuccinia psidii MF-1]|uniref:SHSP domain-containing protein n=1 Tax=Austropuccinia psidii MF-1 TaxID=1389203 RepID=A0A9Q3DA60_9BASI|nr:hypothetical protein [Austropuccinia psidii MF-1]
MSYSVVYPSQWEDFETLFDKLVTDRYGPPNASKTNHASKRLASGTGSSPVAKVLRPNVDLVETDSSLIVTVELPGAKKEDISIDLTQGRITISGQTKASAEHSRGSVRVSERTFGSFSRTIAIPESVTHEHIKAGFTDGILEITIPKIKQNQTHSISIS